MARSVLTVVATLLIGSLSPGNVPGTSTVTGVAGAAASSATKTTKKPKWRFDLEQHDDDANRGSGTALPRRRYSHSAVVVGGEMIVSHGYFFDHTGGGGATWIDDTWAYSLDSPSSSPPTKRWREIYTAGVKPHPRMSHSAVERDGKVVLFGGDDGGHLKGNTKSYQGTYLNDLWEPVMGCTAHPSTTLQTRSRSLARDEPPPGAQGDTLVCCSVC